ncbi:MAG: glycerophosphodiester phosphodiesterase family protein [Candidatus Cohnella colombiensis]|uniref:Glycerophosphodiester phosphodiesterase family protein n=1 Tax=Candidatus Cohnella colombiensis TaxID=3121368 RepID=A0AA95EXL6_9BACL|nr:MAG: glycerophosphodiester phosphodiesterase family protein [Cohnella sp.]
MNASMRAALHPCVAHRGFSSLAPENTMAAFRVAMNEPYVHWMEIDVHLSKDDIPVVIHDAKLKRTTNGKGQVRDHTASELGRLDAGSWFHSSFSGETVSTLEDVLKLTAGKCRLNVEIKGQADDYGLIARQVVDVLRGQKRLHDTVITSFVPEIIAEVRKYEATVRTGLIVDNKVDKLISKLRDLKANFLSIDYGLLNSVLLQQAIEQNIEVMVWTVNSVSDLRQLLKRPEPFQICTNYPDRWLKAVNE